MPGERKQLQPSAGAPLAWAEKIDVTAQQPGWSSYTLSDGTTLRVYPTIVEVWRFDDVYDQNNDPLYQTRFGLVQTITNVDVSLKKKA